jgi:hypothetical protein
MIMCLLSVVRKKYEKSLHFCILKVPEEFGRFRIRIRTKMSRIRNTALNLPEQCRNVSTCSLYTQYCKPAPLIVVAILFLPESGYKSFVSTTASHYFYCKNSFQTLLPCYRSEIQICPGTSVADP